MVDLVRGFAGMAAGLGQAMTTNAQAMREENLRRLEQQFRAQEAATDRDFRGDMADKAADLTREGWDRADSRAAAGRTPASRFTDFKTGADGQVYGITRDGKAEPVMAGDAPLVTAGEDAKPYTPSKDAREGFEAMLMRSPEFADRFSSLNPDQQADAMREWAMRYERGAGRESAPAPAAAPAAADDAQPIRIGEVVDGMVFTGGDPSNPSSWRAQGRADGAQEAQKPEAPTAAPAASGFAGMVAQPQADAGAVLAAAERAGGVDALIDVDGKPYRDAGAMRAITKIAVETGMTVIEVARMLQEARQ